MIVGYKFEKFRLGMMVPNLDDSSLLGEFQILNFSMTSVVSPIKDSVDDIFTLKQVHGTDAVFIENGKIYYFDSVNDFSYSLKRTFEADSVITVDRGINIGIRSADCAPIMFYVDGVVGGIHAGWRGLKSGIVNKTLRLVSERYNVNPSDGVYFILPCIHSCCYEVGKEFLEWAKDFCLVRGDKVYFDIPKFILSELVGLGVKEDNIYYSPLCTSCYSNVLPSYRATKTENRIESYISLI